MRSKLCGESIEDTCFLVGFIARLAPEKSPGLFLMAAHALLAVAPHARFVMVGDGASDLETKPVVDRFVGFGRYTPRETVREGAHDFI